MIFKEIKNEVRRINALQQEAQRCNEAAKSRNPRSKKLKYDTDVPGDRGDWEKKNLTQGSE